MYNSDTIAAVSTAWGEAAIAIVRMSGPDAVRIADSILKFKSRLSESQLHSPSHSDLECVMPAREMRLAFLLDKSEPDFSQGNQADQDSKIKIIDQVLAVYFPGPRSYTGEDMVEIHTHGGTLVTQTCLKAMLQNGARLAEPGEFTRRAFLNNRIDLSQAESVLGIIQARSAEALHAASRTLTGELSSFVREIHEKILLLQGDLEIGLDFPEGEPPMIEHDALHNSLASLKIKLRDLEERCSAGVLLREGVRVVIVGRPNAGKSSLLNALLKQSRAIVTAIPGTTRDLIEESITWQGVPIRLVDTAGLRSDPSDEIEATGIERTHQALSEADICLHLIDGSRSIKSINESKGSYLCDINLARAQATILFVLTKSDLPAAVTANDLAPLAPGPVFSISAKTGDGLDELKNAIVSHAISSGAGALDAGLNVTTRQLENIRSALHAFDDALDALDRDLGQDILAGLLGTARVELEKLLGISCDDILLDSVFSRFCVGK